MPKQLTSFKVLITLGTGHVEPRQVFAVDKADAVRKIYNTNYSKQPDISMYEAYAPYIGLIPH